MEEGFLWTESSCTEIVIKYPLVAVAMEWECLIFQPCQQHAPSFENRVQSVSEWRRLTGHHAVWLICLAAETREGSFLAPLILSLIWLLRGRTTCSNEGFQTLEIPEDQEKTCWQLSPSRSLPPFLTPWGHFICIVWQPGLLSLFATGRKVRQGGSKDSLGATREPDVQLEIETKSSGKSGEPEWAL